MDEKYTHDADEKVTAEHLEIQADAARDAVLRETLKQGSSPWKVLLQNSKALAVILAVQSNAIVVGVEFSLPGNLLGIQAFCKEFGYFSEKEENYQVAAKHLSIWGGLFAAFQVIGQATAGETSDRFGRRFTLYQVIFWSLVGVMLEIVATNWQMWLGSKIVLGFATGLMQIQSLPTSRSVVPTYVSEIAPRELRGISLSFFNMAMNIGGLIATVVPWATNKHWSNVNDLRSFRVPLYMAIAMPVITLIAELFLLVESPYWLMLRGRKEDAKKSLRFINPKCSEEELDLAVETLSYTIAKEAEENIVASQTSYVDCFRGIDARRTWCAVFAPLSQNLTGQNLVGTYGTYFFTLAKQKDPLISSIITTAVGLFSNFVSFFLIESKSVGRWLLLFCGICVMTLCMLALGLIDVICHSDFNAAAGALLVVFAALFISASTLGPGVAGWAYTGESGSSRLRSKTTTLGTMGNAIAGLIMGIVLPYLLSAHTGAKLGVKTAFIFFGLGLGCAVLIYFTIPDFTGRTFAQIDELFYRRIPARQFSKTECTGDYGNDVQQ